MSNSKKVLRQIEKGEVYAYQVMGADGRVHYSNVPLDHPDMVSLSAKEVRSLLQQNAIIEKMGELNYG